jgi:hypothetical protein
LVFGDGTPDSDKTNQLFFDAGPNKPGDSTGGLFGVIHATGDQGANGGGDPMRDAVSVRRLARASDLGGRGLPIALPVVIVADAVNSGIVLNPTTVSIVFIGDDVNIQLSATGGSGTGYTFALVSGSYLPPGLSLSGGGTISGLVTAGSGDWTFTVVATDSIGDTGSYTYTMTVDPVI